MNLNEFDTIFCMDRGKYYPATIIGKYITEINGMQKIEYKIGFRLYPERFAEWEKYKNYWPENSHDHDSQNRAFFGNREPFDEIIPFYSKRIQRFDFDPVYANKNSSSLNNNNSNNQETNGYIIDDYIIFDMEEYIKAHPMEVDIKALIEAEDPRVNNGDFESEKKNNENKETEIYLKNRKNKCYVIAKSNSFSFYYAQLISDFASNQSFEKMLKLMHRENSEKPNAELIYYIFLFIGYSSTILHKEYLINLSHDMKENVISYLNDLNQEDLRNIKKETIEIITKVLRYYLSFSMSSSERNEVIENFGILFALKMLKTSLLDKRIFAIKTIVEIINNNRDDKLKMEEILKHIEENNVFYEIFGLNSHIQLINKSKDLVEIMLSENKLSEGDIKIIWEATKKGDLEGKLEILKLLKEISLYLKENHINMLLENIYSSDPENLIKEEIDLIYDLATHYTQPRKEIEKVINFFFKGLFSSKLEEQDEKMSNLIGKVVDIAKEQSTQLALNSTNIEKFPDEPNVHRIIGGNNKESYFVKYILNILLENLRNNIQNSFVSLKVLKSFMKEMPDIYLKKNQEKQQNQSNTTTSHDEGTENSNNESEILNLENLCVIIFNNLEEYRKAVKCLTKTKNWNKDLDLLPIDSFNYTQNMRIRLEFFMFFIFKKIWIQNSPYEDQILYIYHILVEDQITEKDNLEFYLWIKNLLNSNNMNYEIEQNIFSLFNTKIFNDLKNCQSLSIQGFESYLKIFLNINKKHELLNYYYNNKVIL